MDKEYYDIYRELVELYRAQNSLPPFDFPFRYPGYPQSRKSLAAVNEAIEEAIRELPSNKRLRPDARLFLMVNLHQLVALPLSQEDSPVRLSKEVEIGLKEDARRILMEAAESTPDREEIPASHILWATSKVLDRLNLKSWRIWDRD